MFALMINGKLVIYNLTFKKKIKEEDKQTKSFTRDEIKEIIDYSPRIRTDN